MPIVRIPLQDWIPDRGELNNPGMPQVSGVIPSNEGWIPSPASLVTVPGVNDDMSTSDVRDIYGFHIHNETDTNLNNLKLWFFAGDDDDLYVSTAADSLDMQYAKASPGGFAPTPGSGWQFCSYGNAVVATELSSNIQYAATPSTPFTDMVVATAPISYLPKCRFVSSIKQHLLIGHIKFAAAPSASLPNSSLTLTSYPSLVMWSATDNIRRFGDPKGVASTSTIGSDFQDLSDDYGAITALSGGDDAYIFKERAIYLMEGPPFQFRRIVSGTGTLFPNSVARYHDDVYFWGDGGPMRLRAGSVTPERLGLGKVQRTVLDPFGPTYSGDPYLNDVTRYHMEAVIQRKSDISTFCDYRGGYVVFASTNHDISDVAPLDGIQTKFLVYHVDSERFGFFNTDGRSIVHPRSISTYDYTPQTFSHAVVAGVASTAISAQEMGMDLNGVYFVSGGEFAADGEPCVVGKFAKDATLSTPTVPFADNSPYGAQKMTFSLPYMTFPVGDGSESQSFKSSSIIKIKPIYTGVPLYTQITVRSVSRFPIRQSSVEVSEEVKTYDPSVDSYQDSNGWIDINTVEATHHKITVVLDNPTKSTEQYRILSDARDLLTLEIEYSLGDKYGSASYAQF